MAQKQGKGGGARKYGRSARKPAHQRYNNSNRRTRNKVKRIAQSNGEKAVRAWRSGNGAEFPPEKPRVRKPNINGFVYPKKASDSDS